MTDTVRTIAELQALLADNSTGDISPQDLRDMLVSLTPCYGSLYFTTPAATTIATPGVTVKAAGTTSAVNLSAGRFTMPANNRLQYAGADVHAHIALSLTVSCASNNQEVRLSIAKNGVEMAHSILDNKIGTGADEQALALHADCHLVDGDYLEIFIGNNTSTGSPTIQHGYLFALGMAM